VLKQFGEIAVKLSRSPLSIIALSFVFAYGFAALVAEPRHHFRFLYILYFEVASKVVTPNY
jgi:hypothetical protein